MLLSKSLLGLSLLTLIFFSAQARAQDAAADPAAESGPPSLRGMSPEERQAAYEAMSEEDQQIVRKRQREARDKQRREWEAMTPEQREVRREEMRARAARLTPEQRAVVREQREKNQKARRNSGTQLPQQPQEEAAPPQADHQ